MSDKWRHKSLMTLRNIGYMQFSRPLKKEELKMQKRKFLANPNNFGIKIFVMF